MSHIAIVDDDEAVRDSLGLLLGAHGFDVSEFESGEHFLSGNMQVFDAILLDVRMPRRDGIEILSALKDTSISAPVVMISAHGDISLAVQAVKLGAFDFVEKPVAPKRLLSAIGAALSAKQTQKKSAQAHDDFALKFDSLTPRERQIAKLISRGLMNKMIAHELNISPRTVETHRHRIMTKLEIRNAADLIRHVVEMENENI